MKKPKGKRLKAGADYKIAASEAMFAVSCETCGFSTDVPGAGSGEEAEALVAKRHACANVKLLWEPYLCEHCGEGVRFCDLVNIKRNGIHLAVCDDCRVDLALGRTK